MRIPIDYFRKKNLHEIALLAYVVALEGEEIDGKVITRREACRRFLIDTGIKNPSDKEIATTSVNAHRLITEMNINQ
jgi:hypothetical protein